MKFFLICTLIGIISIDANTFTTVSHRTKNVFALLIIDVQYCFINGSLALSNSPAQHNGADVIPSINHLIQTAPFDVITYSLDWHPVNHISFIDNLHDRREYLTDEKHQTSKVFDKVTYTGPKHETEQVLWPTHCVENTKEAQLHDDLIHLPESPNVIYIRKGTDPDIDSYSAFADNNRNHMTPLHKKLQSQNVTHVFVTGLALDYCVGSTAIDAALFNYKTYVIEDACRGVDQRSINARYTQFLDYGIQVVHSNEVMDIMDDINNTCF
ncbi:unnamed protein product [Adineta ricciae]|uniref:nicotinamidase n=1 Tax=Adineta ricciae TaxID=249248 RepID=A0A813YUJ1_ADIRI|nr:unnamed protein product [Adineta ricciae]CAF1029418.1 unnamed protein product [Adineta ricciae]